ncbi:MAG: M56 family metallopeptidase [Nonlabens sp.]|uniref:M56 family metallopeptidase n=1 Tax=Nonlabens sp. TaxID=1888209 RepID=UPI0032196F0E
MIQHLIHSSILALLFYGVYLFFLRKETFFQWNRAYLLAIPLLSIAIPFLNAPFHIELAPLNEPIVIPTSLEMSETLVLTNTSTAVPLETPIDYMMIAIIIYGIGVFISLLRFLYKISTIKDIIRKGSSRFMDGLLITKTSQKLTAFSFFNTIVIDEHIEQEKAVEIIAHERVHIKQLHSYDLVAFEICKIIFWFHPVPYLVQRELKLIHEYIVDQLIMKNQESTTYQESLLKTVFGTDQFTLASSYFNKSLLKNRILMLQKKKSTTKALFKLAFIIPIVLGSIVFTACTQDMADLKSTDGINAESNNEKMAFLPRLSTFEYGTKDYYNGLTQDDISFSKKFIDNMMTFSKDKEVTPEMFKDFDFKRYLRISRKISENSETLVVDDTDNRFHIIKITESPDSEPSFTGGPEAWNSHASDAMVEGFLDGTGKDNVSDLTNEEYSKLCAMILKAVTTSSDYIEEIIEIEEVYPVYGEIDPNSEMITEDVPFAIIDEVPHFEECTGTEAEIKKCTSDKITKFVNKNFNTGIAKDMLGRHKIAVQFKIDKNGNVVGVQSKAKSTELQNEAARVINMIPQMIPGKQNGKEVGVIYALPIIFEVQG